MHILSKVYSYLWCTQHIPQIETTHCTDSMSLSKLHLYCTTSLYKVIKLVGGSSLRRHLQINAL